MEKEMKEIYENLTDENKNTMNLLAKAIEVTQENSKEKGGLESGR